MNPMGAVSLGDEGLENGQTMGGAYGMGGGVTEADVADALILSLQPWDLMSLCYQRSTKTTTVGGSSAVALGGTVGQINSRLPGHYGHLRQATANARPKFTADGIDFTLDGTARWMHSTDNGVKADSAQFAWYIVCSVGHSSGTGDKSIFYEGNNTAPNTAIIEPEAGTGSFGITFRPDTALYKAFVFSGRQNTPSGRIHFLNGTEASQYAAWIGRPVVLSVVHNGSTRYTYVNDIETSLVNSTAAALPDASANDHRLAMIGGTPSSPTPPGRASMTLVVKAVYGRTGFPDFTTHFETINALKNCYGLNFDL